MGETTGGREMNILIMGLLGLLGTITFIGLVVAAVVYGEYLSYGWEEIHKDKGNT